MNEETGIPSDLEFGYSSLKGVRERRGRRRKEKDRRRLMIC